MRGKRIKTLPQDRRDRPWPTRRDRRQQIARASPRPADQMGRSPDRADKIHNALHPFKSMVVSRVPDIKAAAMGLQKSIVFMWRPDDLARSRRVSERIGPRPGFRRLAHQPMAGLMQIVRHLQRQYAARFQSLEQAKKNRDMIRHPLETGVGIKQVRIRLPRPCRDIRFNELDLRQVFPCFHQHCF